MRPTQPRNLRNLDLSVAMTDGCSVLQIRDGNRVIHTPRRDPEARKDQSTGLRSTSGQGLLCAASTTQRRSVDRLRDPAPCLPSNPRRTRPVKSPTRCPYDNEGRSVGRRERGFSTPIPVTAAVWPFYSTTGGAVLLEVGHAALAPASRVTSAWRGSDSPGRHCPSSSFWEASRTVNTVPARPRVRQPALLADRALGG